MTVDEEKELLECIGEQLAELHDKTYKTWSEEQQIVMLVRISAKLNRIAYGTILVDKDEAIELEGLFPDSITGILYCDDIIIDEGNYSVYQGPIDQLEHWSAQMPPESYRVINQLC